MTKHVRPPVTELEEAGRATSSDGTSRPRPAVKALLAVVGIAVVAGLAHYTVLAPAAPASPVVAPPAPAVTVAKPLRRKRATWTSFTGQFSAVDRVEIRAQVSGYLTEIHFTDGQIVKKGDLLFVIDPRPYEIARQQADAQVQTAASNLDLSKKQLARTSELKRNDYASGETLDQRTQAQQGAVAALDLAKAAARSAALNLEFTRVTAPMTGKISAHRVSLGNLVTGGQSGGATTLLTTIVSLDPIYLDFDMGESDYLAYQRYLHTPDPSGRVDRTVEVSLSDETGWKHRGTLDFVDNEMDRSSGTIHARATLGNGDLFIAPGEFARLRLPTSAPADVLMVPDDALATDQSRKIVMTVAPDGTVTPKAVEIGALDGNLRVIESGISAGDEVIVNGLMRARPGAKVTPQPGTIAAEPDQG